MSAFAFPVNVIFGLNVLVVLVGVACAIVALVRRSPVLAAVGFGLLVAEQLLTALIPVGVSLLGSGASYIVDFVSSLAGLAGLALVYVALFARRRATPGRPPGPPPYPGYARPGNPPAGPPGSPPPYGGPGWGPPPPPGR